MKKKVAILFSGGGSNMETLARSMQAEDHPGEVCLALTNRPDAGGIERAEALGLPLEVLDHRAYKGDRTAFEDTLDAKLREAGTEVICLAGFMRILGAKFVGGWEGKMLNTHPALCPLFPGLDTHARALEAGMAVHGATVHMVTEVLDEGPILGQAVVPVLADDTAETLQQRVLTMEHRLYPAVLRAYLAGDSEKIALFP